MSPTEVLGTEKPPDPPFTVRQLLSRLARFSETRYQSFYLRYILYIFHDPGICYKFFLAKTWLWHQGSSTSLEFSFLLDKFMKNGETLFAHFSFYLICGEIYFIEDSFLQNIFVDWLFSKRLMVQNRPWQSCCLSLPPPVSGVRESRRWPRQLHVPGPPTASLSVSQTHLQVQHFWESPGGRRWVRSSPSWSSTVFMVQAPSASYRKSQKRKLNDKPWKGFGWKVEWVQIPGASLLSSHQQLSSRNPLSFTASDPEMVAGILGAWTVGTEGQPLSPLACLLERNPWGGGEG